MLVLVETQDCSYFIAYLVRVPKEPKDPEKPIYGVKDQFFFFMKVICPIFKDRKEVFLDQKLVEVTDAAIDELVSELAFLDQNGQKRPPKFRYDKIKRDNLIMLVQDMRPRYDDEHTIEFKAKWLAQSPSAPRNANTCRCCALASKKYHDAGDSREAKYSPDRYPCPLWLDPARETREGQEEIRRTAIKRHLGGDKHHVSLYKLLADSRIIQNLKAAQLMLDQIGPLMADNKILPATGESGVTGVTEHDKLGIAMTFRDCSLFVRYREEPPDDRGRTKVFEPSFEVRLADLDRKNVSWKIDEWRAKERALIDEEWYTGRGQMRNCALWGRPTD